MVNEEPGKQAISALTDEETIRGKCPQCGSPVRSKLYYVSGRGYFTAWICDNASPVLPDDPVCDYRRIL